MHFKIFIASSSNNHCDHKFLTSQKYFTEREMQIMLGKQIESLRRKKGWSQAELARRLHISPSTVGMYEQGRREPPIDILIAMAQEFDVTIDYLITGTYRTSMVTESSLGQEAFSMFKNLSREELIVLLIAQMLAQ